MYICVMEILIIVILILLNGIFAMSEVALISARKSSLGSDAKHGSKAAERALKLAEDPDKFLSTVQIGITLIGILTGIYSGATLADGFGEILEKWGVPHVIARTAAQFIIVVVVTYATIIFGELVPKRIGMAAAEKTAKIIAGPMKALSVVASPFVWVLAKSTEIVCRMLNIKDAETKVTEEEIKSIIQEGAEDGTVQEVEQNIVERVFSLGDRTVESIMTHRNDLDWIDLSLSNAEIEQFVKTHPHNVYPVAEGNIDNAVGVIRLKHLFCNISDPDFDIRSKIEPCNYFHERMEVYTALNQLRDSQLSYGLVCDEFGSMQGIVTLKEILEALVGTIPDEHTEPDIVRRDDGSVLVDGQCPFYDFLAYFDMEDLFTPQEYDFTTVSGLILKELCHIPQTGERVEWKNFSFEVVDMDGARIDKILIHVHDTQA